MAKVLPVEMIGGPCDGETWGALPIASWIKTNRGEGVSLYELVWFDDAAMGLYTGKTEWDQKGLK